MQLMYYVSLKLLLEYEVPTYLHVVNVLREFETSIRVLPTYLRACSYNVLHEFENIIRVLWSNEFETIIWSITYLHTCMQLMYYMSLELLYGVLPTYLLACS